MSETERVMERRQVYDAREWDKTQAFLDWMGPRGLEGGPFSVDENGDLYQWGAFLLAEGTWIIDRGTWWDIVPSAEAFEAKYEEAPVVASRPAP